MTRPTISTSISARSPTSTARPIGRSRPALRGTRAKRRSARLWRDRSASAFCPRPTMCGCRWT
ncbi:MAG: phage DNA packaging protein J [Gemmatimonadaceae bacterium]|nr:phage DNA packaging protein J [Caulobacter sp.]